MLWEEPTKALIDEPVRASYRTNTPRAHLLGRREPTNCHAGGPVMRTLSLLIVAAGFFLSLPTAARADFDVVYPNGVEALAVNLAPGFNLVAMFNVGPDPDILTIHLDESSNPVPIHLNGLTEGFAWWLRFVGFNRFGRGLYDVYVTQGAGFFLVGRVVI